MQHIIYQNYRRTLLPVQVNLGLLKDLLQRQQKQKEQWRSYVSSKLEPVDDQENIRRLRETRVPKKLKIKLKRQASEKGLAGSQVDKYIQKVERRMNRRKSD